MVPPGESSHTVDAALTVRATFPRCELQFDYGLRQKRSRKLESRPASFRTGTGKEIVVEKAKAAKREVGLTKGKVCGNLFPNVSLSHPCCPDRA